jgi:NADH:ubiquinone oxidoreductase subunit E
MDNNEILKILEKYNGRRGSLISILEEIQTIYGYLPENALRTLSDNSDYALVDIFGVSTFYKSFKLKPKGKHLISVCSGTACHVRGAQKVIEEFERRLGIHSGETTLNREFTLETVNCLGACALGPIVVVDGKYYSNVVPSMVEKIIKLTCPGFEKAEKIKEYEQAKM